MQTPVFCGFWTRQTNHEDNDYERWEEENKEEGELTMIRMGRE
jgi:hypothetical protein